MLKDDIVEPFSSPWASSVVLVKKKDGSTQFCIGYRKLNAISIKDACPLPRIGDSLFSTLNLASGYWQVGMTEEVKQKSAFVTKGGLYQFKAMPFGLCGTPAIFKQVMEKLLTELQWQICLVCLDDVIVYSKDVANHLVQSDKVFQKLRKAGLTLKPKKCHLLKTQVLYLGHRVERDSHRS